MTTTIQVSNRGSLTLPKALRKRLGLDKSGVLIAEDSEGGIVLRPAVAYPIEVYTESRVAEFDKADQELGKYLKSRKRR
jgi:bifunctional DNA-binding transcriptional regulator/antitoxin component of YhaV-PrlF toxin-antitoxin module